jgi:hypothetical protein
MLPLDLSSRFLAGTGKAVTRGVKGARPMSSAIDFQSDAIECLKMAERASGPEEKSVLQCLARAWMLLSDQLRDLQEDDAPEAAEPNALN